MTRSAPSRLLFIDHAFHERTYSSEFFVEILARDYAVRTVVFDPARPIDVASLAIESGEAVCLWQLDFLAPVFLSRGIGTIVVPMYDGSSILPDEHWLQMRGAYLINFSRALHDRTVALGLESLYLQYFPSTHDVRQVADFTTRRLFFWERTPGTIVNLGTVLRLFGGQVDRIHVHAAPDDGRDTTIHFPAGSPESSVSRWFPDKQAYLAQLEQSNIFVAPRLAEGIGHAFLEAMARGMTVIAYNLPTHLDYISDGQNGILFDQSTTYIDLGDGSSRLMRIGCNARQSVEAGRRLWQAQAEILTDFIAGCPWPTRRDRPTDADALLAAYRAGITTYSTFLAHESC